MIADAKTYGAKNNPHQNKRGLPQPKTYGGFQGKAATVLHSVASSPGNSDSIADLWAAVRGRHTNN